MISDRKLSHLEICRDRDVGPREKRTHLDEVELIHNAAPELDISDVDLSTDLFSKRISYPIIISAMTGGHPSTKKINENLAKAAADLGIGMCVGSQRAAIEDPRMEETFSVVRRVAPSIPVIANIGAAQLLSADALRSAERSVEMVGADAIAVHLNLLQELVQPGGDTRYRGVLEGIAEVAGSLGRPVIVKETGCGISREVASSLIEAGAAAIEVAGAGGTSWAAVEHYNASVQGDNLKAAVADSLRDWGIPTAMSICEVASLRSPAGNVPGAGPGFKLIASGGIKNGLDIARSIALGADMAGIARPLLAPAFVSASYVSAKLGEIAYGLKVVSMLTGARSLKELQGAPTVVRGYLKEWLSQRGLSR